MAYDEELADRIREVLWAEPGLVEKRMFGGLAFLIGGHIAVAATRDGRLMLKGQNDIEASADQIEAYVRPMLAGRFTVIAPDLPGHGFTETPADPGFTLPGVASGIAALLATLGLSPKLIAGHSAGAAVATCPTSNLKLKN